MKGEKRHFEAWSGCDERMAKAAIALKESFDELEENGSRRIPLKRLIREHLDPAFEAIASEFVRDGSFLVRSTFGPHGLSGWHKKLTRLDIAICDFANGCEWSIMSSIDTLRNILSYIDPSPSFRIIPKNERGLKGAARRRMPSSRSSTTRDWPYCELCYRVSEAANHMIYAASSPAGENHTLTSLSARYCAEHSPRTGSAYDRDLRRRERFKAVLSEAFKETRRDSQFSSRFRGLAPADALVNPFQTKNSMSISVLELGRFSDYVSNIRHYAYFVAQQHSLERTIEIATLRYSGLSFSQIARELDISIQAVMQRVKKCRGCFDFSVSACPRHLALLRWVG